MAIVAFVILAIALLWALMLLAVSTFFRGMALAAIGLIFLNLAHSSADPFWLYAAGIAFILFPIVTMFRRQFFGET